MNRKMCAVNIVGGSGFVGTELVKSLISESIYKIHIFDKATSSTYPELTTIGNINSLEQLRKGLIEGAPIINLAAEHRDDVTPRCLYDQVNVDGARNICRIASEKKINKIIFTSSVAVYGFAPIGTNESGEIAPFNDYGRTKWEAEKIYRKWQLEDSENRTLLIIRPTVIFGERNRGNVFNLLKQIASGKFIMVGNGTNRKSMAYVQNVAAFIQFSLSFKPGVRVYNYIDKPDLTMNQLVGSVKGMLGQSEKIGFRLPFGLAYVIGKGFDLVAAITGKRWAISSIRVKKFCADSVYNTAIDETGFIPPVPLLQALEQTIRHEFIEKHDDEPLYFSE